jgi:putative cardiolipin synthase
VSPSVLLSAIDQVARGLPITQVEILASALETLPEPTELAKAKAVGAVATPGFSAMAQKLFEAWASDPAAASGQGLALALRSSASSLKGEREGETIDIVWTGPRTSEVAVRLTREALLDVIRAATKELIILSFAAQKVEVIIEALRDAAEAGVKIRLVLETPKADGGALAFGGAAAYSDLRGIASFLVWPAERRPAFERGKASLHVKAAVADQHTALVTSANLTGRAIKDNMELGLLIRGGPVPRRLASHFRELIAKRDLVEVL